MVNPRSEFEAYMRTNGHPEIKLRRLENGEYDYASTSLYWKQYQHQQSLIDAKDAEIVELRNLHKQTFMAGHEKIQTLTKERDDAQMLADFNHTQFGIQCAYARDLEEKLATANSRIEVQRVNIEALQTNRAQSRNDEGGV